MWWCVNLLPWMVCYVASLLTADASVVCEDERLDELSRLMGPKLLAAMGSAGIRQADR